VPRILPAGAVRGPCGVHQPAAVATPSRPERAQRNPSAAEQGCALPHAGGVTRLTAGRCWLSLRFADYDWTLDLGDAPG
jgi:hypothetical protein